MVESQQDNFNDRNNRDAQKKSEQILNLEKGESSKRLAEKVSKGLKTHSMPNSFKGGKFNTSVHPNDVSKISKNNKKEGKNKHKSIGFLIIGVGVLVLIGLGYFLYGYLVNDSSDIFSQEKVQEQESDDKQVVDNSKDEVGNNENDSKFVDEDNLDEKEDIEESIEEDIEEDKEDFTEIATSTDEVVDDEEGEEVATSTDEVVILDTDNDGLLDSEEYLLNTNINLEDSDGDGYDDYSEVLNLFNPAGSNKLQDNPAIKEYVNPLHNYSILYPETWDQNVVDSGNSVMFMNDNDGFFQVSVEENLENLNINEWYLQSFDLENLEDVEYYDDAKTMIQSEDGLVIYYTDTNKEQIFVFSYIVTGKSSNYPTLFKAFVNSFTYNN